MDLWVEKVFVFVVGLAWVGVFLYSYLGGESESGAVECSLMLYFSNYEHHGIGNTAYFFEDGAVVRRHTSHPSVEEGCRIQGGRLDAGSLSGLKKWIEGVSIGGCWFQGISFIDVRGL